MEEFHIPAALFLLRSLIKAAMHYGRQEEKQNLSDNSKKQQKTGCRSKDPTHMQTHNHNLSLSGKTECLQLGGQPRHETTQTHNTQASSVVASLKMPPNMIKIHMQVIKKQNIYVGYMFRNDMFSIYVKLNFQYLCQQSTRMNQPLTKVVYK